MIYSTILIKFIWILELHYFKATINNSTCNTFSHKRTYIYNEGFQFQEHLPICSYFYSSNMQSMSICYSFRFPQHEKHVPQRLAFSLHVKHICIKRHAAIVVFLAYFFQKNICHESISFFTPCITNYHFFNVYDINSID